MTALHQIGKAFELAFAAHRGQTDKANQPYITHLVRVASKLESVDAQTVALLHDILEDTDTEQGVLDDLFDPHLVQAIIALTKIEGEGYDDYLAKVAAHPIALQVKLADIADNSDPERLSRLDIAQRDRLETKYAKARARLAELAKA